MWIYYIALLNRQRKMKRITIRDVAREANVSVTLVSFVMNAKKDADGNLICPVNAETAKRVLAVAERLGYRRNYAAASLRSGKSNTIAVIPNDISNRFFAGISKWIEEKANEMGYNIFFSSSEDEAVKLADVLEMVMSHNIDGVIVAPCAGSEEALSKTLSYKIPVVLLDRDIEKLEGVGKVLLDDKKAGALAVKEFLSKGYKKIEMISYDLEISTFAERETGYAEAMKKAGLEPRIHHTGYERADEEIEGIIDDAVTREVEALFIPTYSLSAKVLGVMKKKGIKTPEDIALVCFDESDIYTLYRRTITHIVQPLRELGEKSVEILVDMIGGKEPEKIVLNPELIRGQSTEKRDNQ